MPSATRISMCCGRSAVRPVASRSRYARERLEAEEVGRSRARGRSARRSRARGLVGEQRAQLGRESRPPRAGRARPRPPRVASAPPCRRPARAARASRRARLAERAALQRAHRRAERADVRRCRCETAMRAAARRNGGARCSGTPRSPRRAAELGEVVVAVMPSATSRRRARARRSGRRGLAQARDARLDLAEVARSRRPPCLSRRRARRRRGRGRRRPRARRRARDMRANDGEEHCPRLRHPGEAANLPQQHVSAPTSI